MIESYGEYSAIYWAAACLAFWAGSGVTDLQMCDAVGSVCKDAGLTLPQEILLKDTVKEMIGG